jgi:phytoene dehydrogenase-like protein
VLVPLPAGITLSKQQAHDLSNEYLRQIAVMTGVADFSDRIVSKTVFGPDDFSSSFNAWQSTALGPSHVLSQSAFFRTGNKSKKVSNLYYVGGSTVPGIGLPMCLISAELLYKRLAGDRRGGRITSIRPIGVAP